MQEALDAGYRIRRDHTGAVLPPIFVRSDVAADESAQGVGAKLSDRAAARVSPLSRHGQSIPGFGFRQ